MELRVGYKDEAYLHHIYCKVKNWIQGENQVIQSDQDVHMCGYCGWKDNTFLYDPLSLSIF